MIVLSVYVIDSPNNMDNIFLNKNINRLLVDILHSEYSVKYVDCFSQPNIILFAENVKLIKEFIDANDIKYRKCVAITQEVYHETTENVYEEYSTNQIYIYNCFNNKFNLNHFYYFEGVPGGKIDISNKTKDNYSTELYFFGSVWRQNWDQKNTLYKKRLEYAIHGYKEKYISKLFSRDFWKLISLDSVEPKHLELEQNIIELQQFVNRNVSIEEKRILTQKLFYSIEFISTDYINFVTERPFDAICSGCVPIFMGTSTLKEVFPIDSIIYVDEYSTPNECFNYVKQLSYDEWKTRIDKCIKIIFTLCIEGKTCDNLIFKIFKNIINDLFQDLPLFDAKLLCDNKFNLFVKDKNKETYLKTHFNLNFNANFKHYELDVDNRGNFMINLFNSNTPFFLTRHGGTDFGGCDVYFNSLNIQTAFNISSKRVKEYCGYFDKSDNLDTQLINFKNYLNKINVSLQNSFISTSCLNQNNGNIWINSIVTNRIILSYSYIENVMPFFNDFKIFGENKKILIISPFSKTIESQYKNKDNLISGYKYPNFELFTYDIPVTYNIDGINDNPYLADIKFNNWNELVENMCQEINQITFDIALISAGSYTYPLGDYISSNMGKKAIYIGGVLNILFAIRSNRYHVQGSGYEVINPSNSIVECYEKHAKTDQILIGRHYASEAVRGYFG